MMFLGLKAKLAGLGVFLLSLLALIARFKIVKAQRDRAIVVVETLKARQHVIKVQKKLKKEVEVKVVSRRANIIKELKKEGEEFEGIDNLSDSNKF